MAYAENTDVSVEKSIGEIVSLIKCAGAERIAQFEEPGRLAIQFFLKDRMLRFSVKLASWEDMPKRNGRNSLLTEAKRRDMARQHAKQRARALLLVIKAKLESVESAVETFDEAFLSNIVTPGGETVGDWLIPQIEEGYRIGVMPTSLLALPAPETKQ